MHVAAIVGLVYWHKWHLLLFAVLLYFVRMFGVTAGYHRYFSHATFKTNRFFQFLLAVWAETSSQRGVLWWAAHHRDHHKHSDEAEDLHSPRQHGFWYSHLFWVYHNNSKTKFERIKDFAKFPELRFIDKAWILPPTLLAVALYFIFGWGGVLTVFCVSTVLLWHGTFTINSLSHVWGFRRFATKDDSRNNPLLAFITLGEGWHNNHHFYSASARQGFTPWEIDITYLMLKLASYVGIVSHLREPPKAILSKRIA